MDATKKECVAEYYEEHKKLIYSVVKQFIRKHQDSNLNFEEQLSIAHLYFVEKIVPKYNHSSKFSTWLVIQLPYYLQNHHYRKEKPEKHQRLSKIDAPFKSHKMLIDLIDELKTEDAKHVANLIIETPSDLQQIIVDMGGSMCKIKNAVLTYLKQHGWKTNRIIRAFTQIEMAILP